MKFSNKDFFSKCDQIYPAKFLMENFIFCEVCTNYELHCTSYEILFFARITSSIVHTIVS